MALYPHNQKTYDNIVEAFNNGVRDLIIVQGTGVGKSFLTMELIDQYFQNKNTLYICPKECIEINIKKYPEFAAINNRVDFQYNAAFNDADISDECLEKYDVFVIDECHHLGSAKQGANIRKIIDYCKNHKDKYVIGLTATPIREKDKNGKKIDVSTYFSTRVNGLSVFEAIEEGLMPSIEYLVCKPSRTLTEEEKKEYRQGFDIENSEELLSKIIEKNNKNSYLVFYSSIKEMNENTEFIQNLIPDCRIINISSDDKKSQALLDTVKKGERVIIQSVNMLLEGLHLPLMDCVILFRNTQSLVILQQIIGRVSAIGSKINPLIIDCTEAATKTLFKILHEQEIGKNGKSKNDNNKGIKRKRRPIIKISANNSEFFDLSLLFTNNREFIFHDVTYTNFAQCCKNFNINYNSIFNYLNKHPELTKQEVLEIYLNKNNRYEFIFRGIIYPSFIQCCKNLNINSNNVTSYLSNHPELTKQEVLELYLKNNKEFIFRGVTYPSFAQCCKNFNIDTQIIYRYQRKHPKLTKKDVLEIYLDKNNKEFIFHGLLYSTLKQCCECLNIKYNTVYVYQKLHPELTKQDVLDYYCNKLCIIPPKGN